MLLHSAWMPNKCCTGIVQLTQFVAQDNLGPSLPHTQQKWEEEGWSSLIPRLLPSFCRILYSMRQKAGEEPGNKSRTVHSNLSRVQMALHLIVIQP